MNPSNPTIELSLEKLPAQIEHIYLAFSGGVDSCVLLHNLRPYQNDYRITLWHINHGLQANAQSMQELTLSLAEKYAIEFKLDYLTLDQNSGNLEARARHQRYQLFAQGLTDKDVLFTAHHMNDQAETLLLNLMRGSGPAGLRAIAQQNSLGEGLIYRPLLNTSRKDIECYAESHQLHWIEDQSNQDTSFDRNFLRHQVLPILSERWPAAVEQLHRVSTLQGETESLLNDMAKLDFRWAAGINRFSSLPVLNASLLKDLSAIRQRNLIRYWLNSCAQKPLGFKKMHELIRQVQNEQDSNLSISGDAYEIRLYQSYLFLVIQKQTSLLSTYLLQDNLLQLPEINFEESRNTVLEYLRREDSGEQIRIHFRTPNDQRNKHRHTLKRLFQKYHVPTWARSSCPQIHVDDELIDLLLR